MNRCRLEEQVEINFQGCFFQKKNEVQQYLQRMENRWHAVFDSSFVSGTVVLVFTKGKRFKTSLSFKNCLLLYNL